MVQGSLVGEYQTMALQHGGVMVADKVKVATKQRRMMWWFERMRLCVKCFSFFFF